MPDTLLISNCCLLELEKQEKKIDEKAKLLRFLLQWPDLDEFLDEIFAWLCRSSSHGNFEGLSIKAKRKKILKAASVSKKLKDINNLIYAKTSNIIVLRDQ